MKFVEFLVDRIITNSRIIGRNCGDDIERGDKFTVVYLAQIYTTVNENWDEIEAICNISLKIKDFNLYGKSVSIVPSGYVCEIIVEGDKSGLSKGLIIGNTSTLAIHTDRINQQRNRENNNKR